jgi:hypothetical protein
MLTELAAFDELKADITIYVAPTLGIAVTDFKTSNEAIDAGKKVKRLRDLIEKKRKELVGPLNDQVRKINDYAKLLADPLVSAEAHLSKQLTTFEEKQRRIREQELRRIEAEKQAELAKIAAEADHEAAAASFFGADESAPAPEIPPIEEKRIAVESHYEGLAWDAKDARVKNTRRTWKFEVVDASLLPAEFLMPNDKAIRAAVTNGRTSIPGVRTWQEAKVGFGEKTSVSRSLLERERANG